MRLKVEIGDEAQEHEFKESQIFIGADPSCHLVLDYEGIGARHLRVIDHKGTLIVQDLASGHPTYSNNNVIRPGGKLELTSFLPVEIGGIFISALDEVTEVVQDNSLKISFDDDADPATPSAPTPSEEDETAPPEVSEDQVQELKKQLLEAEEEENPAEKKKKYRPQLYKAPGGQTESKEFKLKDRNLNLTEAKKKARTKSTTARKKAKTRKKVRRSTKRRDKYIGHRFNLNSLIIIFCTLMIAGFVYYKKFYMKKLAEIPETKKEVVAIQLKNIDDTKMAKYSEQYSAFAAGKKCNDTNITEICKSFKDFFIPNSYEGIIFDKGTAYIGLDFERTQKLTDVFKEGSQDVENAKMLYEQGNYKQYFSWERFVDNGYMSPLAEFKFNLEKYKNILFLAYSFNNKTFNVDNNIKKIHFFLFEKFQEEFIVYDFLELQTEAIPFLRGTKEWVQIKFRSYWNNYLTADIQNIIAAYGTTRLTEYDDTTYKRHKANEKRESYSKYVTGDKCAAGASVNFCNTIGKNRKRGIWEGIVVEGDKIFVVLDLDIIQQKYTDLYSRQQLAVPDKKIITVKLKDKNLSPEKVNKILQGKDVYITPTSVEADASIIFTEALSRNFISELVKFPKSPNIYFLGVRTINNEPTLKIVLGTHATTLMKMLPRTYRAANEPGLKVFWKTGIPIAGILMKESTELLGL